MASGLLLPSRLLSISWRRRGWWVAHPGLSRAPGLFRAPRSPTPKCILGSDFRYRPCALGTPVRDTPNPPPLCPCPAFYTSSSLAGLLTLGAVLAAAATVREAGGLMAGVSSPCPQSPSRGDGIRSRQGRESPGRLPPPALSRQQQRPERCVPAGPPQPGPSRAPLPGPALPHHPRGHCPRPRERLVLLCQRLPFPVTEARGEGTSSSAGQVTCRSGPMQCPKGA